LINGKRDEKIWKYGRNFSGKVSPIPSSKAFEAGEVYN
jgi:hypothetical protein